jgi:hypothetical protein
MQHRTAFAHVAWLPSRQAFTGSKWYHFATPKVPSSYVTYVSPSCRNSSAVPVLPLKGFLTLSPAIICWPCLLVPPLGRWSKAIGCMLVRQASHFSFSLKLNKVAGVLRECFTGVKVRPGDLSRFLLVLGEGNGPGRTLTIARWGVPRGRC